MSEDLLPALPHKTFDIPEALVIEMAKGLEEPEKVAEAFGITGPQYERLAGYKPFLEAVTRTRMRLEQEGFTFRMQSVMMADMMAKEVFRQAMQPEVPLGQKLEVLRTYAKYADLEPRTNAIQQAGPGTSINIILGDRDVLVGASARVGEIHEVGEEAEAVPAASDVRVLVPVATDADLVPDFLKDEAVSTLVLEL